MMRQLLGFYGKMQPLDARSAECNIVQMLEARAIRLMTPAARAARAAKERTAKLPNQLRAGAEKVERWKELELTKIVLGKLGVRDMLRALSQPRPWSARQPASIREW